MLKKNQKVMDNEPQRIEVVPQKEIEKRPRCPISGSKHPNIRNQIATQIQSTFPSNGSNAEEVTQKTVSALNQVMGINPQDEIEGMLLTHMVSTHHAAMDCLRLAAIQEQTFEGKELNLKYADKLIRTHATLVATLDKHRGKGQQKMTVEHVHVNEGGQAIIGNVNQSKADIGGKKKK